MRWIIYDTESGRVMANIPSNQIYEGLYDMELAHIEVENPPRNWTDYKIIKGQLVEMDNVEIGEMQVYNRILTEAERFENEMLSILMPTHEEIKKAENTIEMLELLISLEVL